MFTDGIAAITSLILPSGLGGSLVSVSLAAAVSAGAASWTKWKGLADGIPTHRRFMALGGVLLAVICAVSILSLMIPAAVHRPCD